MGAQATLAQAISAQFLLLRRFSFTRPARGLLDDIMLSSMLVAMVVSSAVAESCKVDSDCSTGLSCVVDSVHNYSECVDCSAKSFATQCFHMSDSFLPKAEEKCGITQCSDRCPHHGDTECDAPKKCVVGNPEFAQCIDCTPAVFNNQCKFLPDQVRTAAEAKCNLKCETACKVDKDCAEGLSCVVDAEHAVSQCVDCSLASFSKKCFNMNDPFLIKAEEKCSVSCPNRCPHHTSTECAASQGKTCVVQGDGYFAQCIDCTEKVFDIQCKYFTPQFLDAAEKACKETCPKNLDITV